MKWPKVANLSSVCMLLIFTFFSSSGRAQGAEEIQNYTLEYPCEIVLLIDDSNSVEDPEFKKLLNVVGQIPKHFKMRDNYTRVAVITFATASINHFNLTANESLLQSLPSEVIRQRGETRTDVALRDVKEKIFVSARPEALKVVILITDGIPEDFIGPRYSQTEAAAEELKKDGSLVYVAFVGDKYQKQNVKEHIDRVAGDLSRVFPIDDFDALKKNLIPRIQEHLLCQFEQVCRYDDPKQQKCVGAWWRPRDIVGGLNCTNAPPTSSTQQCQMGDCNATCEKWPWQSRTCDENSTEQRLMIIREGTIPPKQQPVFENCLMQKEIVCRTEIPAPVKPEDVVSPPTNDTSELLRPWAIAVIAVVVGLLLLLVVAAVVLTLRKRKKERRVAAMAKKKKEMATMATKKAGDYTARSSAPSLRSYSLEAGDVPMIDRSVGVSLTDRQSILGGATSASEMLVSPSRGPAGMMHPKLSPAPAGTMAPKPSLGERRARRRSRPLSNRVQYRGQSRLRKPLGLRKGSEAAAKSKERVA